LTCVNIACLCSDAADDVEPEDVMALHANWALAQ
jgi:hypothetical protein